MARQYFEKAAGVWQYMIDNDIQSDRDVAYYYTALSRQKRGQWEGAIEYYQKVVDNYPDFEHICAAKAAIGWCYEILRNDGKLTKEEINPFIEQVYMDVLEEYPDCYVGDYVAYRLGELNLEKGDTVNAALYYRKFLELARPSDMRIEDVNEKLEKLEGKN
jgi:tetratricopeptide (TPR) repeat protein